MGTRETALGPTVGGAVHVEEGVLLLDTEPGLDVLGLVHDLLGMVAVVGAVRGAVVVVALGENEDVLTATERILEDGSGTEVDVRVAPGGLVGRGTVKVPDTEVVDAGDLLGHGLLHRSSLGFRRKAA